MRCESDTIHVVVALAISLQLCICQCSMSCVCLDSFWISRVEVGVLLQYHWSTSVRANPFPGTRRCSASAMAHGVLGLRPYLPFSPTVLLEPASVVSTTAHPPEPPPRTARPFNPPLSNCHTMCVKHFGSYCIYRTQPLCGKRASSGSGHWAEGEAGV